MSAGYGVSCDPPLVLAFLFEKIGKALLASLKLREPCLHDDSVCSNWGIRCMPNVMTFHHWQIIFHRLQ